MNLQYTAMNTLAFVALPPERATQASSVTSAAQYLVISFGIALSSWLLAVFLSHHLMIRPLACAVSALPFW
jgi:hypothetical protein